MIKRRDVSDNIFEFEACAAVLRYGALLFITLYVFAFFICYQIGMHITITDTVIPLLCLFIVAGTQPYYHVTFNRNNANILIKRRFILQAFNSEITVLFNDIEQITMVYGKGAGVAKGGSAGVLTEKIAYTIAPSDLVKCSVDQNKELVDAINLWMGRTVLA